MRASLAPRRRGPLGAPGSVAADDETGGHDGGRGTAGATWSRRDPDDQPARGPQRDQPRVATALSGGARRRRARRRSAGSSSSRAPTTRRSAPAWTSRPSPRARRRSPSTGFAGVTKRDFPKPLIAAVNGSALAGGFEIMLSCDLVVAASHARFGIPEAARGLIAGGGGPHPARQAHPAGDRTRARADGRADRRRARARHRPREPRRARRPAPRRRRRARRAGREERTARGAR